MMRPTYPQEKYQKPYDATNISPREIPETLRCDQHIPKRNTRNLMMRPTYPQEKYQKPYDATSISPREIPETNFNHLGMTLNAIKC